MAYCKYYKHDITTIQREFMGGGRQRTAPGENVIGWCEHPKHSPLPRELAHTPGAKSHLKCKGMFENCPIKEVFEDV